jgi:signal transduction histidine kinase
MNPLASLQSRMFLASALLTVCSIAAAIYLVRVRVNVDAEETLRRDLVATGELVEQLRTTRADTFATMARLFADAPKLKAAVSTNDPLTVQDVAEEYQVRLHAQMLLVTNRAGEVLATIGTRPEGLRANAAQTGIAEALQGRESASIVPAANGMLQLATVPISIGLERPDILGALSVGFLLDDALSGQLKSVTGSDIALAMEGRILASTLPEGERDILLPLLQAWSPQNVVIGPSAYVALALPLSPGGAASGRSAPVALILRSRAEQQRFLREINTELVVTAVVGVLLATLLSFAVARSVTRPLAAITSAMKDVAATGDLTRKIAVRGGPWWQDEDARILATTFNTLTDSIARFQRGASQRERLSALGRLSTVIAHEVRNPLMIIKAALHELRQPAVPPAVLREAVADIDGEVGRLDRIVNEVLDFARPIRFELAPTDLNALCRESADAAQATPGPAVTLHLDPAAASVTTDAERLRLALVNLIANARQAVEAGNRAAAPPRAGAVTPGSPVSLRTQGDADRVRIVIADQGQGIDPLDLPRVFDPYFTTKRGGTGLGLPIAKNIVDGLGGSLSISSARGRGTELSIELPRVPERAAAHA